MRINLSKKLLKIEEVTSKGSSMGNAVLDVTKIAMVRLDNTTEFTELTLCCGSVVYVSSPDTDDIIKAMTKA